MRSSLFTRDWFRPAPEKKAIHLFKEQIGFEAYAWDEQWRDGKIRYFAVIWNGAKSVKPVVKGYFTSDKSREAAITDQINRCRSRVATKKQRTAERNQPHTLKVGDILSGSWGYEQTNVEFYEVVGVPSPCYVEVRELCQSSEATGFMQGTCRPVPGKYTERSKVIRRKAGPTNSVKISESIRLSLWDGRTKNWTNYA